jgi:hypothetical protein
MMTMSDPLFVLGNRHNSPFSKLPGMLKSESAIVDAYVKHAATRWVVLDASKLGVLASLGGPAKRRRALVLAPVPTERRALLSTLFAVVITPDDAPRLLPEDELAEALSDERSEDLFIGGVVDKTDGVLVLYRGNLEALRIPLSWFRARPKARPDFELFEVTDYGQTVRFGEYEASADAILFEFDSGARRRMKAREVEQDSSLGGAVRRLRLARGLARSDFSPLDEKTIARIERGETEPRDETLKVIASRLGVKPDDVGKY